MIGEGKLQQFQQLIESFSSEELIWINGYLAGIVAKAKTNGVSHVNGDAIRQVATKKITLVYGTETGNSKRLATSLAAVAKKKGISVKISGLDQYRLPDLATEEFFFVITSTHGEGEPPAPAKNFYDQIHQLTAKLPQLKYSVLALGDTSYSEYCKTGVDIDSRLDQLGAVRVVPLQKCDVDFEEDAQQWFGQVLKILEEQNSVAAPPPVNVVKKPSGRKFYNGTILRNINLNDRGSNKQTFHIEIGANEKIEYEPGDAIAIIPVNKKIIVDHIISLTGIDRNLIVETSKAKATIEVLLTSHLNICYLSGSVVKKYAALAQQEIPDVRIDLADLLRIYPLKDASQFSDVIKILSTVAPRLYSISSSPAAHGNNEIHLTVSRHSFRVKEEQRFGLCSDFLGELPAGTPVNFYIHRNRAFKLPPADKDIIMIGPGTGVAPFRSFLAERDVTGAQGRNWFFFGDQHFTKDFLYQSEMQNFFSTGVLTKISLAFSRDREEKIYVQHRMIEQARELFDWINKGASVYLSGTKDPNSKDIENALLQVIEEQGQYSKQEARNYLKQLEDEHRYEKDVY